MSKIKKLGLGIVAFEGIEHIKNITYEIRDSVDLIVVCLQKKSYFGNDIDKNNIDKISKLQELGYIDDIIWFEPIDLHEDVEDKHIPRYIETDKRNFILDYLENNGCSHSLIIDSDEFYDGEDFKYTKKLINDDDSIKITYCQYINYYRDYRHLLIWPYLSYVPFITESNYRFLFKSPDIKYPSDLTRRYKINEGDTVTELKFSDIKMHHLSWIRIDITQKLQNWSSKKYFETTENNLEKRILNRYNEYRDGMNAVILFNTPNNEVCVNLLNKAYIHPRYFLNDDNLENIKKGET